MTIIRLHLFIANHHQLLLSNVRRFVMSSASPSSSSTGMDESSLRSAYGRHKSELSLQLTSAGGHQQNLDNAPKVPPPLEAANNKNNSIFNAYLQLSKCRLTSLIACTTVCGFVMSPAFASAPHSLFISCVVGTALLSAAASTFNNVIERQYDKQMLRTRSRVLPVGRLSAAHALLFASATGIAGLGILCLSCNHITSALGFINLALYACVYTPMKRIHHSCTWIGAVVGAIPPLMGYAAANGHLDLSAIVLGAVLFSWQFPHFNALSWKLRADYAKAGYRMMCVTAVPLCRRTTLRHSFVLLALCSLAAPCSHLTTWAFAATSLPLNGAMLLLSSRFYANMDQNNATNLFRFTLLYLPALLALMFIAKEEHRTDDRIGIAKLKDGIMLAKSRIIERDFPSFYKL